MSVPCTVARGLHTNVYQVELGHSVTVKNMKTQTLETIEKGSLVWVFDEITEFEYFFKFVYANQIYQTLQSDLNDGVTRDLQPKKPK